MPRVTTKGQVTIPKDIREDLGIEPGDEVRFTETETGYVVEKSAPTTADGEDPFERYRGVADTDRTAREELSRLRGEYPRQEYDESLGGEGHVINAGREAAADDDTSNTDSDDTEGTEESL